MARLADEQNLEVMKPELGTKPRVYYRNLWRYSKCFIGGTLSEEKNGIVDCIEGASVQLVKDGASIVLTTSDNYGDFKFDKLDENSAAIVQIFFARPLQKRRRRSRRQHQSRRNKIVAVTDMQKISRCPAAVDRGLRQGPSADAGLSVAASYARRHLGARRRHRRRRPRIGAGSQQGLGPGGHCREQGRRRPHHRRRSSSPRRRLTAIRSWSASLARSPSIRRRCRRTRSHTTSTRTSPRSPGWCASISRSSPPNHCRSPTSPS